LTRHSSNSYRSRRSISSGSHGQLQATDASTAHDLLLDGPEAGLGPKEHLLVPSKILVGRVLCKVTPAMHKWGLFPEVVAATAAVVCAAGAGATVRNASSRESDPERVDVRKGRK
jgi:hypothetical protein